jgi:hypothetical protein
MLELTFTGFVNGYKTFDWGTVIEMSHPNRKRNAAGEWETTSTDYVDVVIDKTELNDYAHALNLPERTRIAVTGVLKPAAYLKKDGTPGIRLKVYARGIEQVQKNPVQTVQDILAPVDTEVPF